MAPAPGRPGLPAALWWVGLAGALVVAGALASYVLGGAADDGDGPVTTTTSIAPPTASTAPEVTVHPGLGPYRDFMDRWMDAQVTGDVEFLLGALDEEVLARYGADACRSHLAGLVGTVASLEVVNGTPRAFDYSTDGRSTEIPDAWELSVAIRSVGEPEPGFTTVHLRGGPGGIRWFTDCGEPRPESE